ncbi:SIR2 family protein [uncultured Imperialibacter sp.]|uniref:TPR end-of-group domain-containing protein n=1 Tax=uncultured Imperialibacter sp. TaxID=1672639 RepID=UPI0030DBFB75|tara:strand:- start:3390 stop:5591 length:2202 start_codon:yes stop_codon:yes gene_type:complete
MKEISIEELAYLIKQAKNNNRPQPIFFLGAGASVSGGIPLASDIVKDILAKYPDSPFIEKLEQHDRSYSKLMECLLPHQRNELLKKYINEAKINVTHIYLAQLIKNGFIDYILTVNFDNLMLRALALFNQFPSTYDMAILKDLTTTTFNVGSVVYLHGQHHGLWLLNTKDEMEKVKTTIPRIFDSIKNERPWIFIGYSGFDPVFEHIKGLGRFDNGLYWVGYRDNSPNEDVQKLLTSSNTNAFYVKGYDSDAFMLKLNEILGLEQPEILDKPFSSLQAMLTEINDINDEEHFKGVRERLEMAKKDVIKSIQQFEMKEKVAVDELELQIDKLKKEIIGLLISESYDKNLIASFEEKAKEINETSVNSLLAELYLNWGTDLGELAGTKKGKEAEELYQQAFEKFKKVIEIRPDEPEAFHSWGAYLGELADIKEGTEAEVLYQQAFEKFKKVIEIKPSKHEALYNWGTALGSLAESKEGKEAEGLYQQAFEKFKKAVEIKPDKHEAFNNWGTALGNLAKTKEGKEAEDLYQQAVEKFKKAIEIKPDKHDAFNNWGTVLGNLAETKEGKEAENLYQEAFEKFKKAIEVKPDKHEAFNNWGTVLTNLAKTKKGEEAEGLYQQAFAKFKKAIEISPNEHEAFNNLGTALGNLAKTKEGKEAEEWYQQAFEKFKKAIELGGISYNLSCAYALKREKENALKYLSIALLRSEIDADFVLNDEDWKGYLNDPDFEMLIQKHS